MSVSKCSHRLFLLRKSIKFYLPLVADYISLWFRINHYNFTSDGYFDVLLFIEYEIYYYWLHRYRYEVTQYKLSYNTFTISVSLSKWHNEIKLHVRYWCPSRLFTARYINRNVTHWNLMCITFMSCYYKQNI